MMEKRKTIQEIIDALRTLRLQEADLTAQLEEAIEDRQHSSDTARATVVTHSKEKTDEDHAFPRGKRIWIKNKLRKPASWNNDVEWIEKEARTATATRVVVEGQTKQVHFVTDNGVHTWRAPNNIHCLA